MRLKFGLRASLLVMAAAAVGLALWPRAEPPTYGVLVGTIRMDHALTTADASTLVHITGKWNPPARKFELNDSPLGPQVVVVVVDVTKATRGEALAIAGDASFDGIKPHVHFLELTSQTKARIRSFDGVWGWEQDEHVEGALAAMMVLDQLSFRVPRERRATFGGPRAPMEFTFASGDVLRLWYTNDWGGFYLRKAEGPERLTRRLVVKPYAKSELESDERRARLLEPPTAKETKTAPGD